MKYKKNSSRQSFSISSRFIIISSSSTNFKNLVAFSKFAFKFSFELVESVFDVSSFVFFHVHVEFAFFVFFLESLDVFIELDLLAFSTMSFFDSSNAFYFSSISSNFIYSNFQWLSVSHSSFMQWSIWNHSSSSSSSAIWTNLIDKVAMIVKNQKQAKIKMNILKKENQWILIRTFKLINEWMLIV
jgi:hypothetical protein